MVWRWKIWERHFLPSRNWTSIAETNLNPQSQMTNDSLILHWAHHLTSIHWEKCYGETQLHLIPSLCWGASEFCPWESSVHASIFWNVLVLVLSLVSVSKIPPGLGILTAPFIIGLSQGWSFFCPQFMLGNMEFGSLYPPWVLLGHRSWSPHCSANSGNSLGFHDFLLLSYRV